MLKCTIILSGLSLHAFAMWMSIFFLSLYFEFKAIYLILRINSTVEIVEHKEAFRTTNALEIMKKYP